ncbi:MAG: LPS biosynthesis glycosyltransferase, partial [Armatimonadota bacterium]
MDQYVDVARTAGAPAERAEFALVPYPEDLDKMTALLSERDLQPHRVILMNAGAGWASKRWPAASFAALADG